MFKFQQLIASYPELEKPAEIQPDTYFEIRLTKEGLWTFKEASQRHYGTVYVVGSSEPGKDIIGD